MGGDMRIFSLKVLDRISFVLHISLMITVFVMLAMYLVQREKVNELGAAAERGSDQTRQCILQLEQQKELTKQCIEASKQYRSSLNTCEKTNEACFRFFTAAKKDSEAP